MMVTTGIASEYVDTVILDNALVMITVLDNQGKIIIWNHAAETITGYPATAVIGSNTIWQLLYPDREYRAGINKKIAGILADRNYFENLETTIRTKSNASRIILWNTKRIIRNGEIRTIAVGLDITEQREADAFRESIIDNAYTIIAVLAPHGRILVWNKAAESITGYARDEVVGDNEIWTWMYPDPTYRKTITHKITAIIRAQNYFENLETTIVTKSGEKRIISWNTRRIDTGGEYREIAIGRDITDQRMAEKALIAYISEIAMRLKQPVEIIRDNLQEVVQLSKEGKITTEELMVILESQIRNAGQIAVNVQEFQTAILEKNPYIPEAYRTFLEG